MPKSEVRDLTIELSVPTGDGLLLGIANSIPVLEPLPPKKFTFVLCHKPVQFGNLAFRQFWIKQGRLLPIRNRAAPEYFCVLEYFWARCWEEDAIRDEPTQDVFILASILPHIRSTAAHKIVDNATETIKWTEEQHARQELDQMLLASYEESLTPEEFRDKTAEIIGPVAFSGAIRTTYDATATQFLGEARRELEDHGRLTDTKALWRRWRENARDHGSASERQILDILSFESKAAFYQCYSLLWADLVKVLAEQGLLDETACKFHLFWHLDQRRPLPGRSDVHFHLFHGLPLASHPAAGRFIQIPTGQRLMADWLTATPDSWQLPHARLLHGLYVALLQYHQLRAEGKLRHGRRPN